MAQIVVVDQFPKFNLLEVGELTADIAENAVTLPVINEGQFDDQHPILIGNPGSEKAEIKTPSAVADESITVGAVDHPHKKGTKIYKLRGNKARIYRAANVDGSQPDSEPSYSLIGTITLQADDLEQEFLDATGGVGFWYLFTYYNDIASVPEETSKVLTDAVRGGDYGHYVTVEEIRNEAGFQHNPDVTDQMIADRRDDAEGEVRGAVYNAGYTLPLAEPIPNVVKNVTKLLAAGYLLLQDYGVLNEGTNKEGSKKVELAQAILKKILSREIILFDDVAEVPHARSSKVSGWPNASTATTSESDGGGARKSTMHDKF